MKSYERFFVWLNYFDAGLKRSEGRRLPLNSCVRSPTLGELTEASRRLEVESQPTVADFPRVPRRASGYVSVKRIATKQKMLIRIARELSRVRGEKPREDE